MNSRRPVNCSLTPGLSQPSVVHLEAPHNQIQEVTMVLKKGIVLEGVIFLIAIFIAMAPDLSESHAQTNTGTEIVSLTAEKCLDVRNASVTSGADVRQYGCHEGANQKWRVRDASTPGYVSFVNQNS